MTDTLTKRGIAFTELLRFVCEALAAPLDEIPPVPMVKSLCSEHVDATIDSETATARPKPRQATPLTFDVCELVQRNQRDYRKVDYLFQ